MLTSAPQSRSHLQNIHKPSADICRVEMKNQILQDMSVFLNIFKLCISMIFLGETLIMSTALNTN